MSFHEIQSNSVIENKHFDLVSLSHLYDTFIRYNEQNLVESTVFQ